MSRPRSRAFTLVELLVVIAIIVILLALLVGGLEKALKAAERSKCGTNQRSIAQACASYALEYDRTFPVAKTVPGNVRAYNALTIRNQVGMNNFTPTEQQHSAAAVGMGHLVVQGRVAGITKGGEALACPTLDTTSARPVKAGMDERDIVVEDNSMWMGQNVGDPTNVDNAAGPSFWADRTQNEDKIMGSYHYRGLSYMATRSGGAIRTNIAKATFVITTDSLSMMLNNATNPLRIGRLYHHIDGWNVSYGDGHVAYVKDDNGPIRVVDNASGKTNGFLEETVIGSQMQYPGPAATGINSNTVPNARINGVTQPGADEAVFAYLGRR
jgi:prepilin-type N-terminal cleavage/methylation domain-containing protein